MDRHTGRRFASRLGVLETSGFEPCISVSVDVSRVATLPDRSRYGGRAIDRVPNWELGVWPQTRDAWEAEGLDPNAFHWNWFPGETALGMDPKEFIPFRCSMLPPFEEETLAEDERTVTFRDSQGRVRKALKEGTVHGGRMSMDTYITFPVTNMDDWRAIKPRLAMGPERYEANWDVFRVEGWRQRRHPLVFGPNCSTLGFYWTARELLGTEGLSYAFYDRSKTARRPPSACA